jgi:formylmethanofuran dehydrogenase subunit C
MSDRITLTLRQPLTESMEVDSLAPDQLATLSAREIAALPVWAGDQQMQLGDLFSIDGDRSERVLLRGDLSRLHGVGMRMRGGMLTIEGAVGHRVAAGLTAGDVTIVGDAGDDAGVAMSGGVLRIHGNAGARLAAASPGASKGMTGGEVIVDGSVGPYAAARARRGLVVIGGDAGEHAANRMIAGTVVVFGAAAAHAGIGSKRGSIVGRGAIVVPPTYAYACTFDAPHVRFLLQYLRRRRGVAVEERWLTGRYRRFCGDIGDPGKGEIVVFAG